MICNIWVINAEAINPVTLTIDQACQRHAGLASATLCEMCLTKKIKAEKVGKHWHITVAELDRVFCGAKSKQ